MTEQQGKTWWVGNHGRRHGAGARRAIESLIERLTREYGEEPVLRPIHEDEAGRYIPAGRYRLCANFESDTCRGYVECWCDTLDGEWEYGPMTYKV